MTAISRRSAVTALGVIAAPAIVRASSLMRLRSVTLPPIEPVYYGFNDRLRLYHEYGIVLPARAYSWPSILKQGRQVRQGRQPLPHL